MNPPHNFDGKYAMASSPLRESTVGTRVVPLMTRVESAADISAAFFISEH
jgi:hypothetical protein